MPCGSPRFWQLLVKLARDFFHLKRDAGECHLALAVTENVHD